MEREAAVHVDLDAWYEGRVYGQTGSHVRMHLEDGMMTARIQTQDDTVYHVEPAWRHVTSADQGTMIVYRESDVVTADHRGAGPSCHTARESAIVSDDHLQQSLNNRTRRSVSFNSEISDDKTPRLSRCPLMLVADYRFFKEMGGSSTKTTVSYLISLIDRVHRMYEETDFDGYTGMGFTIKKILVHTSPTPTQPGALHYNMFRSSWDVRQLLEVFSREPGHADFCLAHLFTDTKFDGGVLGLAYVGSHRRGSVGGVCSPKYYKGGHSLNLNTGLSSSRNHQGQRVITREADLVTAHELGHNWGSEHDPDMAECSPRAREGGSYLMYTYAVSGYDVNNKKFSPCSLRSIKKVLAAKSSQCFTEPEDSFCGNLRVESDEECDAGFPGSEERDPCCDENCRLRPRAQCSDKNSACCEGCRYARAGQLCRQENLATCDKKARCTGLGAECPQSAVMEDGVKCEDEGSCKGGRCQSFCEARGGQSCQCDSEEEACLRCCRSILSNSTCSVVRPSMELPIGTPCYQGLCNSGVCEKTRQEVVRFWDIIDDFSLTTATRVLKDNLVLIVILVTLSVWIPVSVLISWLDHTRREAALAERKWRQQSEQLVHPSDNRRVVRVRVPRSNGTRGHRGSGASSSNPVTLTSVRLNQLDGEVPDDERVRVNVIFNDEGSSQMGTINQESCL